MDEYDGRQFVGIDLHRQRSVIVRQTEAGEQLSAVRIVNDPVALGLQIEDAGPDPSGRVPHRVDAATKTALLGLLDHAVDEGWTVRRACHELQLGELRAHRWVVRRALGQLADKTRADHPCTGCSTRKPSRSWRCSTSGAETDRSHRKLAHRGSYLHRVWVSPSSVRRVLFLANRHFRPLPKPGRSRRKPFPDWVDYKPNSIWIYDTTHFTRSRMTVLIIQDLVSRKWITEVVSAEETSTQVEVGFTNALEVEGLLDASRDAPTGSSTSTPTTRLGRSCSRCPTMARR
jgi:putative transposase